MERPKTWHETTTLGLWSPWAWEIDLRCKITIENV